MKTTNRFFLIMVVACFLFFGSSFYRSGSGDNYVLSPTVSTKTQVHSVIPSMKCLSDRDIQILIEYSNQAIIAMPAKAAGSSLKQFASRCNEQEYGKHGDNFLNRPSLEHVLDNSLTVPSVIASHIYQPKFLERLIMNIPRKTLMIYSHREETSRLVSAISHVMKYHVCGKVEGILPGSEKIDISGAVFFVGGECYISEKKLVEIVKAKYGEIHLGSSRILSCGVYQAVENYTPTMVFMDYRKADRLQELLSQNFCSNLTSTPVLVNAGHHENIIIQTDILNISLNDWLQHKSSTLEWSLELSDDNPCTGKIRKMEDMLFSCNSGFLTEVDV